MGALARVASWFRTKAAPSALSAVPAQPGSSAGFWGVVRESFTGAWQRNVEVESLQNMLAFSAVYACVSLIADDISKLRIKLVKLQDDGTWQEAEHNSPFLPFLRKPNRFQTRIQFLHQWVTNKLMFGNAYVLKDRTATGVVSAGYLLDPRRVVPLVAPDGSVWYRLYRDDLAGVEGVENGAITVPASEIIHDRMITPWHPLIGVSPIFACGASATQGIRIQNNSAKFFENMARPSGQLYAPGAISQTTADRLRKLFEDNFSAGNIGRIFVGGDGLKYEPMTMPFVEAQLIEQLRYTAEDVARAFHVPLYKLGGPLPTFNNAGMLNQEYYSQTLQVHIEAIELLIDEGLDLGSTLGIELDLDGLLRLDPQSRAETASKLSGIAKVNELRLKENYGPVEGGDSVFMQQQYYSLAALAKRDASGDPFAKGQQAVPALPSPDATQADQSAKELADSLIRKFTEAARA